MAVGSNPTTHPTRNKTRIGFHRTSTVAVLTSRAAVSPLGAVEVEAAEVKAAPPVAWRLAVGHVGQRQAEAVSEAALPLP